MSLLKTQSCFCNVRSLTCDEKKTDKTRTILEEVCGSSFNEIQQSVVAVILNSIHNGLRQQMAGEGEQMSQMYYDDEDIEVMGIEFEFVDGD